MPYRIKNLGAPLFSTLTGTVKNIVIESVSISGHDGNTGAIACKADGTARIYNVGILSGSVGGTTNTGGLVGLLDGTARVINCYSFADITGGTNVGGIVGYNNVTTNSDAANLKTMVMNCMFYGDITGGTTISPIYGGNIISNAGNKGVGNYNYFRLEAPYVQPTGVTYNCALGAEDRFLQRFEFYRHLLNSHRELAGWWATGTYSSSEMLKWVLEPSQLGTAMCYPVLKESGKYPSVVNIDVNHSELCDGRDLTVGSKLDELSVTIQMGSGGAVYAPPTGAAITTSSLTLNITDKDPDHYNFNYYKVQLPYYNDVGTKNYNGNRVVTGWKIVSITGGTAGTYSTGEDVTYTDGVLTATPYNFADRNCTNKDLYSESGRVFNQGAYWDVPEGVTSITIEPYWAKCVYLADPNADKVYNTAMETGYDVPRVGGGQIYTNGNSYSIAGESQVVYTTMGNAISSSNSTGLYVDIVGDANDHSVYDYAVVLVGNYHHFNNIEASKAKPYTVTSIDLDGDNEPDYSYILRFNGRTECHPVRADFINIPGLGMAQKSTGGTGSYNFGILIPKGWFEGTNTSLFRFTQFEYENSARSTTDALIVQGGVMEQWVSYNQKGRSNKIPYIHVGGNVWFKEFHTGCHQDKNQTSGNNRFQPTKHSPISVTGGDFDEFYLTGLYVANAGLDNYADNAECYINGGHFGTVCGAAMEGIGNANGANDTGNITWLIQNADIHEFYAGGLNAAKPVTGNLSTTIIDSHVDIFCGGPKFGDMSADKTVTTNATGCTFGTFFGAGYGGNSYSRYAPSNQNSVTNINWNNWVKGQYKREYKSDYGGVSTQFSYQFLPMSDNKTNCARILVDFVKFSLATCRNVTSTLTGCKITGNFYGGGSLGKVDGPVTSTLENCMVNGSVFGAGFSGNLPTVEVDSIGFRVEPYYYDALGTYRNGVKGATTTYTWEKKSAGNTWVDNANHILYTDEDLTALGTVTSNVMLNIGGTTTVSGDVYGGGALASSNTGTEKTTTVNLTGGTITGSVYGGAMGDNETGPTVGNTLVNLNGTKTVTMEDGKEVTSYNDKCVVNGSIFGCNNINGTPKGNATVHIYKTWGTSRTSDDNLDNIDDSKHKYHLQAVYGGGNLAAYDPDDPDTKLAKVIIDGCDLTSIKTVYGGGNAASTPATQVDVNGTYEIEEVFGGGNGKDQVNGRENPGANVGYYNYTVYDADNHAGNADNAQTPADRREHYQYGTGKANVNIYGGLVHRVYGGSNTKGNVRQVAVTMLDNNTDCEFKVDEAYGGGKSAPMDGAANLVMQCIPGLKAAYGGAENANINDNVSLNITNGTFERVFGGNNVAGTISGTITVNIEETGCKPIIIGQLYGGGNQAAYTGPRKAGSETDRQGPTVNVRSFTSIGDVFGGGYGQTAVVTGDTYVNINEVYGKYYTNATPADSTGNKQYQFTQFKRVEPTTDNPDGFVYNEETGERETEPVTLQVYLPPHAANTMGAINNVYGGGNAAKVVGNTYVNIGTEATTDFVTKKEEETEPATSVPVLGASIAGNVYGGGNNAEVTRNAHVQIGQKYETPAPTPDPTPDPTPAPGGEVTP